MADIDFQLPPLVVVDLDEHFRSIALDQVQPYSDLAHYLLNSSASDLPKAWQFSP